jgi:hypothetical protein
LHCADGDLDAITRHAKLLPISDTVISNGNLRVTSNSQAKAATAKVAREAVTCGEPIDTRAGLSRKWLTRLAW